MTLQDATESVKLDLWWFEGSAEELIAVTLPTPGIVPQFSFRSAACSDEQERAHHIISHEVEPPLISGILRKHLDLGIPSLAETIAIMDSSFEPRCGAHGHYLLTNDLGHGH